jgi:hypothetical protein
MRPVAACVLVIVVSTACGQSGGGPEHATEVATVRSGNLDVVLRASEAALARGKDTATIEFRSTAGGSLVDVGRVTATATMPMAGMAPMSGAVTIEPTDAQGRYLVTSEMGMAGQWRLDVEWNGPAGSGSARFAPMVQ